MTKQEIQAIIDEINALEGEEKQAAIDAFKKIADARKAGDGTLPQEMEIEEDPDLIDPESENDITDGEDADIEDPEDVLRHKKRMSDDVEDEEEDEEPADDDDGMSSSSGGKSKDSDDDESDDDSDDDESEDGESGEESDDDSDDSSSKGKSGSKDDDEKSNGNGGDDEDDEESDEEGDDEAEDDKEGKGKGKDKYEPTDEEKKAQSDLADMLQDIFGDDFEKDETSAEDDDEDEDEEDDDDFGLPIGRGNKSGEDESGDEEGESADDEENDDESDGDDEDGDEAMPHGHEGDRIDYGKEDPVHSEEGEDEEGESDYGDGEWKETSSEGRHLTEPGQEADDEEDEDEYDFSGETGIGADDFKDKEKEEKKKNEFFRRKLTISRLNSALGRAREIADAAKNEGLELHEADANSYKKIAEAERMLQELIDQYEKDLAAGEPSDAEEFDDKVAAILDIIEAETDEEAMKRTKDKEDRVAEIEKDEEKTTISDLEAEDNDNRRADPNSEENKKKAEREKARLDAENKKKMKGKTGQGAFGGGSTRTMQQLKIDLEDALSEQVDIMEREYFTDTSWSRLDRHHPDLLTPGEFEDERRVPVKMMPTIDVYIDQSGSWGDDDVKKVLDALKSIDDLVYDETTNPEGKVILNVYYFGYQVLSQDKDTARSEAGGESWDLCIENILSEPETKNVIFVTDDDIKHDYGVYGAHGCINGPKAHIDGFVWWIWKNNYERVPAATRALTGDLGYKEYILSNERHWWR